MQENPSINNRLACLVRDLLKIPYIKPVFVVFAAFGIHLIKPFYSKTIQKGTTHSQLGLFYNGLFSSMNCTLSVEFFMFSVPQFEGVSQDLFNGVEQNYGEQVVEAV